MSRAANEELALERAITRFRDGHPTGVLVLGGSHDDRSAALERIAERLRAVGIRFHDVGPARPLSVYAIAFAMTGSDRPEAVLVDDLGACSAVTRHAVRLRPALSRSSAGLLWVATCSAEDRPGWDEASTVVIRLSGLPGEDQSARCDGLDPVLTAAAAIGPRFTPEELQHVVGQPIGALLQPLADAVASGTLVDAGEELAFATPARWQAVRDAADGLTALELGRRVLELQVRARAVDRLCVAWPQLEEADLETVMAASVLVSQRDPLAAAGHLAERLTTQRPRAGSREVEALITRFRLLGGDPAAAAAGEVELAGRPAAGRAFVLAELFFASHTRQVLELALRTLGGSSLSDVEQARLRAIVLVCRAYAGDFDDEQVASVSAWAARTRDASAQALVHLARTLQASSRGDLLGALRQAALVSEQPVEESSGPEWWIATVFRAKLLADLGRLEQAEHLIDTFALKAERRGQLLALPALLMVRATCAIERADLDGASTLLHAARALAASIGRTHLIETNAVSLLLRIAHVQGSYESLDDLRRALEVAGRSDARQDTVEIAMALAADGLNDVDEETGRVRPVVASRAAESRGPMRYALARGVTDEVTRLRVLLRQGYEAPAREVAELIYLVADAADSPLPDAAAHHARGLVDRSPESLRQARALYEELDRPMLEAQLWEDLGELETQPDARVAALRQARDRWQSAGANREVARVDWLLRAAGVKPERAEGGAHPGASSPVGLLGLTVAEHRVVRELLTGASNAEIAERLFLSRYTVAAHLRRIYARTGARNRRELAEMAEGSRALSTKP